jgi:hypothetical protein
VPVLDRRWRSADHQLNNLNHRANVACLRTLREESVQVLLQHPDAYLRGVGHAVPIAFTSTVPDVRVRAGNQDALRIPGRVEALLLGAPGEAPGPLDPDAGTFGPQWTEWVLAGVAVFVPGYLAWTLLSRRRRDGDDGGPGDAPVRGFMLYLTLTGVVLTQLTEVGENNRLMVMAWPMLLAGAGLAATELARRRGWGSDGAAALRSPSPWASRSSSTRSHPPTLESSASRPTEP